MTNAREMQAARAAALLNVQRLFDSGEELAREHEHQLDALKVALTAEQIALANARATYAKQSARHVEEMVAAASALEAWKQRALLAERALAAHQPPAAPAAHGENTNAEAASEAST